MKAIQHLSQVFRRPSLHSGSFNAGYFRALYALLPGTVRCTNRLRQTPPTSAVSARSASQRRDRRVFTSSAYNQVSTCSLRFSDPFEPLKCHRNFKFRRTEFQWAGFGLSFPCLGGGRWMVPIDGPRGRSPHVLCVVLHSVCRLSA